MGIPKSYVRTITLINLEDTGIEHSKGQVGASFRGSVFWKSSISTNGKTLLFK